MRRVPVFLLMALLVAPASAWAGKEDQSGELPPPPPPVDPLMREAERARWQQLQQMSHSEPELYQQSKEAMTRQLQINEIVSAYSAGSLSEGQAQQQLYPLIQQDVITELPMLEEKIIQTQKKLVALQDARSNPESLVRKRIDELLGKTPTEIDQPF
jgi:hypothetical protein